MRKPLSVVVTLVLLAFAAPALAQTSGDFDKAEAALSQAWDQMPLGFSKIAFITEATGFGVYKEKADAVFKQGEPIVIYAAPVGYGFKDNADGTHDFGFDVDLKLKTPGGEVVAEQANFSDVRLSSHAKNREFFVTLTLNLTDAPAGDFIIEYVVRDIASDKSAVISLPFTLAAK